jgi:hypothetical protein
MQPPSTPPDLTPAQGDDGFWRRLLHHWFVEYNPLYLVSASLVLGGSILWSKGLVEHESLAGPLGVALVAELYAASLALGAALLTRIGQRRPAVMLALLFVLYQWDTTLHTETCAYLGWVGAAATFVWVALFGGKLYAIAWALRVRFEPRFAVTALVAAAGLALGPRVLPGLGPRYAGALLAAWLFGLASLYQPGGIASLVDLDGWGLTVLRRATRATWAISGGLVALHVLMWQRDHDIPLTTCLLAAPLLAVCRVRGEWRAWATVAATLVFAALAQPSAFFTVAALTCAALVLRAMTGWTANGAAHDAAVHAGPYRAGDVEAAGSVARAVRIAPAERVRLVAGGLFATYLALWTLRWSGGPWPLHVAVLDAALALVVVGVCLRTRARAPLAPLLVTYGHLAVSKGLVSAPKSSVTWGETIVALGFAMLAVSLAVSYRLRSRPVA